MKPLKQVKTVYIFVIRFCKSFFHLNTEYMYFFNEENAKSLTHCHQ